MPRPIITSPQRKRRIMKGKLQIPSSNVQTNGIRGESVKAVRGLTALQKHCVRNATESISEFREAFGVRTRPRVALSTSCKSAVIDSASFHRKRYARRHGARQR